MKKVIKAAALVVGGAVAVLYMLSMFEALIEFLEDQLPTPQDSE